MDLTNKDVKKKNIVDELIWDDSIDAIDVDVDIEDNTAILRGTVPTFSAKINAERDALMVSGIDVVRNELKVEFPLELTLPDDQEISDRIRSKLLWDSSINSSNIEVETAAGVVTLSGTVDSYWERTLAEDLALSTSGVIGLENNLSVSLIKTVVDADIENDIREAFKRNPLIDEKRITVSATDGIVTLSGTVPNYFTKTRAYNTAMYTSGVIDVIDNIAIV